MAKSAAQYQGELLLLQPPGFAFTRDPASRFAALYLGWGQEMARLSGRVDDLAGELDPRTAVELLPEWQQMVGLPDPCVGPVSNLLAQRQQLMARLDPSLRGQSIPILEKLAAFYGYPIASISEPQPWGCNSPCGAPMSDIRAFAMIVIHVSAAITVYRWTCNSSCDDGLGWWSNALLECEIRRRCPPDCVVAFIYGD